MANNQQPTQGQPSATTPAPTARSNTHALQDQQQAGANDATAQRAVSVTQWASSGLGRLIMFALLIWAGFAIQDNVSGFWAGVTAGGILIILGLVLRGVSKSATPLIKNLIWWWPSLVMATGVMVFVSIWLLSGPNKLFDRTLTKVDLHTSCEATDLVSCDALKKHVAEERAAKQALADAYGQTERSVAASAAVVASEPATVPDRIETKPADECEAPEGTQGCYDLTFYDWGTPWQLLVEERGVCPMPDPKGLTEYEWVNDTALIRYTLAAPLQELDPTPNHYFQPYRVKVVLVPPGTRYKGELCPPLLD